jgi:hypothetical protein
LEEKEAIAQREDGRKFGGGESQGRKIPNIDPKGPDGKDLAKEEEIWGESSTGRKGVPLGPISIVLEGATFLGQPLAIRNPEDGRVDVFTTKPK